METRMLKSFNSMFFWGIVLSIIVPGVSFAEVSGNTNLEFKNDPINLSGDNVTPLVMINASNDHQLFFKAYNDYSDFDDNGLADKTYIHTVSYYGYFDSTKCYEYNKDNSNNDNSRFEPRSDADADNYCTGVTSTGVSREALWSGNFLNWVSMSRIDVIRKILFGGHRRVDTSTTTVLERSYLPHDAHSWAKYYNGSDLQKLTPFTAGVEYTLTDPDLKKNGITFANTTDTESSGYSQTITNPPLIKVVKGNYSLWAANERWQCTWADSNAPTEHHDANNSNVIANSGINAYESSPKWSDGIGQKNYIARVQTCVPGLIGKEKCKLYPGPDGKFATADDNYKPIGLLQDYGDEDQMYFGMIGGTYDKHASGGSLIRNVASMTDEINVSTDGTFTQVASSAGGPKANNQAKGLINALSLYRIVGYDHNQGTYNDGAPGDNCVWGLSALADVTANTRCKNWGNPYSEIFYQSINYFAGGGIITPYKSTTLTGIPGLPLPQNYIDPLTTLNYCARLSVVNFNSSISSYDADQLDTVLAPTAIWNSSDIPATTKEMTDVVGAGQSINGKDYFIGEANGGGDQLCSEKTVNHLGDALGLCPEAPRLQGSFRVAGLAYYAHTKDIRSMSSSHALTGSQNIDTFSVSMASAVPAIVIPPPTTGDPTVTILPACRNTALNPMGNCAIVDFKVVDQVKKNAAGKGTGKIYINWEDSEQGGDYDQDMWGILEYELDPATKKIKITTNVIAESTSYAMGFGYVLGGTTQDGFHAHSGIKGYTRNDTANIISGSNCAAGCQKANAASTAEYTLGDAAASILEDPLWYASKWGGFDDNDGSGTPNDKSEWDKVKNATGATGSDDIPDNYFYANDPSQLNDALNRVFINILQRASSGTAAAVVSNNVSGVGALYQAYYEPIRRSVVDNEVNEVSWIGTVQALWLDDYGFLREDKGNAATLDGYMTDQVIQQYYDETAKKTRIRRFVSTKDDEFAPFYMQGTVTAYDSSTGTVTFTVKEISGDAGSGPYNDWTIYNLTTNNTGSSDDIQNGVKTIKSVNGSDTFVVSPKTAWFTVGDTIMTAHFVSTEADLEDIGTIWNARELLSFNDPDGSYASTQREFKFPADGGSTGGRFIKTWVDDGGGNAANANNGVVDAVEFVDFNYSTKTDHSTITASNYGFLNVANETDASSLVDYIRGKETANSGDRNRTINYDGTGSKVMRLADVVNATPTVIGAPQEAFNLLYKDESYGKFRKQYAKRRQVLYVGSNGGMLHAFNGGFYDSTSKSFLTSGVDYIGNPVTKHPLGAEIWAYVPMNLLPHLKWLKDPNYTHVYYMDGKPKVFDAKIFDDTDPDYPGGWGTVLVAGMRFGGGKITVDTAADGLNNDSNDRTFRSAYVIMDITNPEKEPKLLAEIQLPDGSFSTSYPAVLTVKDKDNTSTTNKWFLTFGSGPTNQFEGNSTQNAKIYILDLEQIAKPGSITTHPTGCSTVSAGGSTDSMNIISCDTGIAESFIGDPISVDWQLDYKADSIYFGVVGDKDADSGLVMRFETNAKPDPAEWASAPTLLINNRQPVVSSVTPGVDESGQKWIFFGTGRLFVKNDRESKATQSIYGVKEDYDVSKDIIINGVTVDKKWSELLNVTSAQVATDGNLAGIGTLTKFDALETDIAKNQKGWYLNLPPIQGAAGTAPATRVINGSALAGGVLFTTAYQPSLDPCTGEGFSRLYGLYYKTGTAYPDPAVLGSAINTSGVEISNPFIELGHGFATTPSLHTGSGSGDKAVSVFTQLSTGAIIRTEATTINSIRSGVLSWSEK